MWKKVFFLAIFAVITKICIDLFNEDTPETKSNVRIFTADELKQMTNDKNIFLSILGLIK